MKIRPWTLMYMLAAVSVAICIYLLYVITASGNPSIEWIVWTFFGIGFSLAAAGFWYENDQKRKQGGISKGEDEA